MIVKRPGAQPHSVIVTFRFPSDSYAEDVHLVGDFNNWDRSSLPFNCCRNSESYWELSLELPAGQRYAYKYLVNRATWVLDSRADDYSVDAEGNTNSVVIT
ncbi:MAG: isoamylase early set domain-containing protein [Anaerolineae bacterium]